MQNTPLNTSNIKISSNTQFDVFWDKNIVDYNIETGTLTAKNEGKTKFSVSYTKGGKVYSQSVNVNVVRPAFAQAITLEKAYTFFLGTQNNTINCNIKTQNGENYNLDILCSSLDSRIFQTNKNTIIPQNTGTSEVVVHAISGYDEQRKEFEYVHARATVTIVNKTTSLSVSLCDNLSEELQKDKDGYVLFKNKKENSFGKYYAKLEADEDISSFGIQKANDGDCWDINKNDEIIYKNSKTVFVPIAIKGFGEDDVSFVLTRQNDEPVFVSESQKICVHAYFDEENIKLFSPKVYTQKGEITEKLSQNFDEFLCNEQTGKYELFVINQNEDYFSLAIANKKYFYGVICFDNYDANCYNKINASSSNLKLEKLGTNLFYFEALECGNVSIKVSATAIDGSVFEKEINFYVQKVVASSYEKVQGPNITLKIGEELDFALTDIVPVYASVDFEMTIQSNLNVLSMNGTKVVATNVGEENVLVSIDGKTFNYLIKVIEKHNTNVTVFHKNQTDTKYLVGLKLEDKSAEVVAVKLGDETLKPVYFDGMVIVESEEKFFEVELTLSFSGEEVVKVVEINWE